MPRSTFRRFLFTLNNYTDEHLDEIQKFGGSVLTTYVCYGLETASTGTPHVQGYFSLKTPIRMVGLKRKFQEEFPFMAHCRFEEAVADRKANKHYCFKTRAQDAVPNEIIWESEEPRPGTRTDLQRACETLQTQGIRSTAEEYPHLYVRYHAGFQALQTQLQDHRDDLVKPKVWWWWGETGTHKTRTAFGFARKHELTIWKSSQTLQWWPGYSQQKICLIDDFRADFVKFHCLLTILDRYAEYVEIKGGHVKLNSEIYIVTSCHPPWSVYNTREDVGQLLRRIDQIVHFSPTTRRLTVPTDSGRPISCSNASEVSTGGLGRGGFTRRGSLDECYAGAAAKAAVKAGKVVPSLPSSPEALSPQPGKRARYVGFGGHTDPDLEGLAGDLDGLFDDL